jgi:hypothetical protein
LLEKQGARCIAVAVIGGGCSGFAIQDGSGGRSAKPRHLVQSANVRVVVDQRRADSGSLLEQRGFAERRIKVINPNAVAPYFLWRVSLHDGLLRSARQRRHLVDLTN